jgi:hypothetical protein
VSPVWSGHGLHFGKQVVGYSLEKQGTAETYHVALEPWGFECDCPDGQYRAHYAPSPAARACKHAVALKAALATVGLLPVPTLAEVPDPFSRVA